MSRYDPSGPLNNWQPEYGNPDGSPGVYRPEGYVRKKPRTPHPSEMVREAAAPKSNNKAVFQAYLDANQKNRAANPDAGPLGLEAFKKIMKKLNLNQPDY